MLMANDPCFCKLTTDDVARLVEAVNKSMNLAARG